MVSDIICNDCSHVIPTDEDGSRKLGVDSKNNILCPSCAKTRRIQAMGQTFDVHLRHDEPGQFEDTRVVMATLPAGSPQMVRFKFIDVRDIPRELADAVGVFHFLMGIQPNVMVASASTYDQIDKHANRDKERIHNDLFETPSDDHEVSISSFSTREATLDFAIDEEIEQGTFVLVSDDQAEFVNQTE